MAESHSPVALVTGGTGGIGFHIAAGLAAQGRKVVISGRDEERGRRAAAEMSRSTGGGQVSFRAADHSTVGGNNDFARAFASQVGSLDLLVNNVGGIFSHRWETADGYEGTLALNFVGPFTLTSRLTPLLRASQAGRCVNIVSSAFQMVKGDPFADLQSERRYTGIGAYARAKLLNVAWSLALADREEELSVYAVNPGMAWTPSTQRLTPEAVPAWRPVWPVVRWFQRRASAEKAAAQPVRVASTPDANAASGSYLDEHGKPRSIRGLTRDPALAQRAWAAGEQLASGAVTG